MEPPMRPRREPRCMAYLIPCVVVLAVASGHPAGQASTEPLARAGVCDREGIRDVRPRYPELPPKTVGSGIWLGEALIDPAGRVAKVWPIREPKLTPPFPPFNAAITDAIRLTPPGLAKEVAGTRVFKVGRPLKASLRRNAAQDGGSSATGITVPHPFTSNPAEILENVAAAVRQTHLDESLGFPALSMREGELRARRILDVKSLYRRPDYYVVELEDKQGIRVANVLIDRQGFILEADDLRGLDVSSSINLVDLPRYVRRYTSARIRTMGYVWAPNFAEPGSALSRPLASAQTDAGVIFVNSRGEAWVEEESPLLKTSGAGASVPVPADAPGVMRLRKLVRP